MSVLDKFQKRIYIEREDENCKTGDKIAKELLKKVPKSSPLSLFLTNIVLMIIQCKFPFINNKNNGRRDTTFLPPNPLPRP